MIGFIRRPNIKRRQSVAVNTHAIAKDRSSTSIQPDHPLMPRAHECVDELNALLLQLSNEEPTEPTVIAALQRLLGKYKDLQHSSFQESVSQLIQSQCEIQLGIILSQTAIQQLWQ